MAECEAEVRRAVEEGAKARVAKLRRRSERYRNLVADLRRLAERATAEPRTDREEIREEIEALRERLLRSALALIHAREEWRDLQERWKLLFPSGEIEAADPPPDAPEERRAAHDLLKVLLS